MPKKKQALPPTQTEQATKPTVQVANIQQGENEMADKAEPKEEPKCGHVNRHYTGKDVLACVLKPGHEGNHKAPYTLLNGQTEMGEWKDEAGIAIQG